MGEQVNRNGFASMPRPSPTGSSDGRPLARASSPSRVDGIAGAIRRYDTGDLFGPDVEIEIAHQQSVYRLKITRQGKLILNK